MEGLDRLTFSGMIDGEIEMTEFFKQSLNTGNWHWWGEYLTVIYE